MGRKVPFGIGLTLLLFFSGSTVVHLTNSNSDAGRLYSNDEVRVSSESSMIYLQPSTDLGGEIEFLEEVIPDYLVLQKFGTEGISGRKIIADGGEVCVSNGAVSILCWMENTSEENQILYSGDDFVSENEVLVDFSSNGNHICSIVSNPNGSIVKCMGENEDLQLGNYEIGNIEDIDNWTHISVGEIHSCGIKNSTLVYCWGNGIYGQLGLDKSIISKYPILVKESNREILQLESGDYHSCTLDIIGIVDCWGSNSFGQTGTMNRDNFGFVSMGFTPGEISSILVEGNSTCGIFDKLRKVECFGMNMSMNDLNDSNTEGERYERYLQDGEFQFSLNQYGECSHFDNGTIKCSIFSNKTQSYFFDKVEFKQIIPTSRGFCGIRHDTRMNCVNADGSPYMYPQGYRSIRIVDKIESGLIYGYSEGNGTDILEIPRGENRAYQQIRIVISIEEDNDEDDWGDSVEEMCNTDPWDRLDYPSDLDYDTICDRLDDDADGDGVRNSFDKFPQDPLEWKDDDADGIGSNSDSIEISPGLISATRVLGILSLILLLEMLRRWALKVSGSRN